jgi:hypothetical protein
LPDLSLLSRILTLEGCPVAQSKLLATLLMRIIALARGARRAKASGLFDMASQSVDPDQLRPSPDYACDWPRTKVCSIKDERNEASIG